MNISSLGTTTKTKNKQNHRIPVFLSLCFFVFFWFWHWIGPKRDAVRGEQNIQKLPPRWRIWKATPPGAEVTLIQPQWKTPTDHRGKKTPMVFFVGKIWWKSSYIPEVKLENHSWTMMKEIWWVVPILFCHASNFGKMLPLFLTCFQLEMFEKLEIPFTMIWNCFFSMSNSGW